MHYLFTNTNTLSTHIDIIVIQISYPFIRSSSESHYFTITNQLLRAKKSARVKENIVFCLVPKVEFRL